MTKVKVTYLALDEERIPITSASTFENLKDALDDYFGVWETDAECLGFTAYDTQYPDAYEGYYTYRWHMILRNEREEIVDKVYVYCIDFFPHTIIEN
jgi:hypothetical protein